MTKEETHYVIAHGNTLNLFENNKSLIFTSREKAKKYLDTRLSKYLQIFWYITSVKDYNAICEKCNHKWDLEMKPMETITCPNCKTVYDALIVVNDPENKETMRIVREYSEVEK